MSAMDRSASHARLQPAFLIVCLIGVLVGFGLHSLDAGDHAWANPLLDSHHAGDCDDDAWPSYFLPALLTGFVLLKMGGEKSLQRSIVLPPQFLPPK